MRTKVTNIREQSQPEIEKTIEEKRGVLHRLRFEMASRETKNIRTSQAARREIAQMLTVLGEKRREE